MKLIIEDDEGRKTVVPVVRDEITIGRQDGNTIKLTERNVSRRHARLWKDSGSLVIEDLGSYNGVRVNGDKIAGPTPVKEGDLIEIGDYDLGIQGRLETPIQLAPVTNPGTKILRAVAPAPASPAAKPSPAPLATAPAPLHAPPTEPALELQQAGGMGGASAAGATAIIRISDLMKSQPQVEAEDLPKNQMPRLVGLAGTVRGKEFYLLRTEVKVGRTEENDIGIDHQSMSRQHCRFVLEQGVWKVYDNKSANGVRITSRYLCELSQRNSGRDRCHHGTAAPRECVGVVMHGRRVIVGPDIVRIGIRFVVERAAGTDLVAIDGYPAQVIRPGLLMEQADGVPEFMHSGLRATVGAEIDELLTALHSDVRIALTTGSQPNVKVIHLVGAHNKLQTRQIRPLPDRAGDVDRGGDAWIQNIRDDAVGPQRARGAHYGSCAAF